MPIPITNSQNSKVYIAGTTAVTTTAAEVVTAITAGKQIGCLQSLGAISSSRSVQEYSCLSSDDTAKSFGSLSLGNMQVGLLFNANDTAGQDELKTMYSTNSSRKFIVELTDQITPTTGNPTYIIFTGALSSEEISIEKDAAVMYNVTIEIASKPVIIKAT
jgi:hypothetical protein